MKKTVIFLLSAAFMFTIFSCGSNKPAENLNDLKEKYKNKSFKNCDEFIAAYEEMMDVYFKTMDKVAEGDEDAINDLDGLEEFMDTWNEEIEKFEKECPEKLDKLGEKLDKKLDAYFSDWTDDWLDDDELEAQMTEEDYPEFEAENQ